MPCKSTKKLGNLPSHLQCFELSSSFFLSKRWKALSKSIDDFKSILKNFRSLIGYDPFESLIIKIHDFFFRILLAIAYPIYKDRKKLSATKEVALSNKMILNKSITSKKDTLAKEKPSLTVTTIKSDDLNKFYARLVEYGYLPFDESNHSVKQIIDFHRETLSKITKLNLSKLKLKTLPKELLYCTQLKTLNLSFNCIERLPDWFGELKTLVSINLSKNRLYNLPASFFTIVNLKTLFLHNNRIIQAPLGLSRLPNLKKLVTK